MTAPSGRSQAQAVDLPFSSANARGTTSCQRSSQARRSVRGRESLLQRKFSIVREENTALRGERVSDARRMAKVIPLVRFARATSTDVAQERALGVIQLEVERIARRCDECDAPPKRAA